MPTQYSAVVFCQYPAHFVQLGDVPRELLARGFQTTLLLAFGTDQLPLGSVPDGIITLGNVPFWVCDRFHADVFITKLVGQPSHFPPGAIRVHLPVTLTNFGRSYADAHFKDMDAVASAGPYQTRELQEIFTRNGWAKSIMEIGYPRLDRDIARATKLTRASDGTRTIVFAPTHRYAENEDVSVLHQNGIDIVESLLREGYRVVFRPHPDSLRDVDAPVVHRIRELFGFNPQFAFDLSNDYFDVLAAADALLTDVSGTALSFGLCFSRPVIWFQPNPVVERLSGVQFGPRPAFGARVRSIDELLLMLPGIMASDATDEMLRFRNAMIANPGSSAARCVEALQALLTSPQFEQRLAERCRFGLFGARLP